jgi:trehalose synthase
VRIVPPAIDPNSARNMPLPEDMMHTVLRRYGIDPLSPLVCQVSPCDNASDLVGAVDTICSLRRQFPELQLALVLTTEPQDPAGRACYEELARRCAEESRVFVVSMVRELGNVELNVFQRAANVVMQRGLRKGFGLWVSDALWKEKPVVVGPAPGLLEQVIDGETGLVARNEDEFEHAIARLLAEPELGQRLGESGRKHVSERFLITRFLRDYLQMLDELHRSS